MQLVKDFGVAPILHMRQQHGGGVAVFHILHRRGQQLAGVFGDVLGGRRGIVEIQEPPMMSCFDQDPTLERLRSTFPSTRGAQYPS